MRQWIRSHLTEGNAMVTILAFIVLGGMSYAATGGNFILGQSNSASSTTSLTRTGANAGKGLQLHLDWAPSGRRQPSTGFGPRTPSAS